MKVLPFLALAALGAASTAQAQTSADMKMPMPKKSASAPATPPLMTEGVVQSVDAANGVITLKHGEIVHMQMGAMTMAFGVADKKMLSHVKAGDKVKFRVEMLKNAPTVIHIEPSR
jgi:Cu(I)/Ag(I) efflux system membrane protein CusA/SilA